LTSEALVSYTQFSAAFQSVSDWRR